jgi:cell division protein FtsL
MNFQELTKREKVLAIFFIAITVIYAVARGVTEYLLDPDRLLPLIILSLGGVLFFYLMQRLSMRRKALITNKSNSSLQKIYSIFYFLLVCAIIIGGYIELYGKISKLKTESPFFIPTRETIVNNYNNKIADFNEVIKLMEKSNSNQIIEFSGNYFCCKIPKSN